MFSLSCSSSSFVIRVNLFHPQRSLFLYGLFFISLVLFCPSKLLFSGFLQIKRNFVRGQNDLNATTVQFSIWI